MSDMNPTRLIKVGFAQTDKLLSELTQNLKKYETALEEGSGDYGMAADLGFVNEKLIELNKFLS